MLDITKKNATVKFTKPFMKGEDGGYYWPEWNDEGQLIWQASEEGMPIIAPFDVKGEDGGYYIPHIDEAGELNWVPSNENMPAVEGASLATKEYVDEAVSAIPQPDLKDYALKTDIPDTTGFITMPEVEDKGYQTEAQVLAIVEENGGGDCEVFTPATPERTEFVEASAGLSPTGNFVQGFIDKYGLEYDTTYYLYNRFSYSSVYYLGTTVDGGEIATSGISWDNGRFKYDNIDAGVICYNFYNVAGNYIAFQIASAKPGLSGLVPAPQIGDEGNVLKGDGTWATMPISMDTNFNTFVNDYSTFTFTAPFGKNNFIGGTNNTLTSSYNGIDGNHIEGSNNKIEYIEGYDGYVMYNHIEGTGNIIRGTKSHIDGQANTIGGSIACANISGRYNTIPNSVRQQNPQTGIYEYVAGNYAHITGNNNTSTGESSSVEGKYNNAYVPAQHVQGKYSIEDVEGLYADIVGNGTAETIIDIDRSNAYTLDWSGNATFAGTITSATGADYAEYFEWFDGNPEEEDRVGYIVKLNGNKIEFANADDDILGIISGTMTVLGDNAEWYWQGKYLTDDFGRIIYEDKAEWGTFYNPETQEEEKCIIGVFPAPKLNPNYDADMPYENRKVRPEWDAVGMMGKLFVRDDGTAQVNGYVTANNGIATASGTRTNMRVMERISENIIRVCLK